MYYTRNLTKKLNNLTKQTQEHQKNNINTNSHNRVINLSKVKFTEEQLKVLRLGPQFATEREPKHYINHLIIDTDNAIKHLNSNEQNAF